MKKKSIFSNYKFEKLVKSRIFSICAITIIFAIAEDHATTRSVQYFFKRFQEKYRCTLSPLL